MGSTDEKSRDCRTLQVSYVYVSFNPNVIEIHVRAVSNRVFWRVQGLRKTNKNDTKQTWLTISGLEENAPYELVIKAGNRDGTSTLTQTTSFTLSDKYIISASTQSSKIQLYFYCRSVIALYRVIVTMQVIRMRE